VPFTANPPAAALPQAASAASSPTVRLIAIVAINYLARLDRNDVMTGVTMKIIDLLPDGECSPDKMASARVH